MTVLLGAAPSIIGPSEVGAWMAASGAPGAAALLDFAAQRYGFRSAAGVPRRGSIEADLTFARASAAGRWPESGPYEMVDSNVLRYDHDPVTREPLGVRIEGAATNLFTNSEFPNGVADATSRNGATAVSDIEGGRTGLRLNNSASTAWAYRAVTATAGVMHTIACDVEMEDGAPPAFGNVGDGPSALNCFVFNVGGSIAVPSRIEQIGTRVWRCFAARSYGVDANYAGVAQYLSNQQRRIKVTGFQLEAGAVASSYIVTGASVVTRAAERLEMTLPFDASVEGVTVVAAGRMPRSYNPSSAFLAILGPPDLAARSFAYAYGGNSFGVASSGSPLPFTPAVGGPVALGSPVRGAFSMSPDGEYRISVNGGAVSTRAGVVLLGANTLEIGNLNSSFYPWNDCISRVAVFRGMPFTDEQLRGLLA